MNKKEKILDFILCLTLGYLGIHKFYEKKTGLGILYFFTLGIFGLGWLVDIVKLFINLTKEFDSSNETKKSNIVVPKNFNTNIAGVTFDNRQSLLKKCSVNQKVLIKWDKDNPYSKTGHALAVFTIINGKTEQLGHIPESNTNTLFSKYEKQFTDDNSFAIDGYISKITGGTSDKPTLGCVIKI